VPSHDPAQDLAEYVCRTRFADLPPTAVAATISDGVDTLGCMLGGSGAAGVAMLLKVLGTWGGARRAAYSCNGAACPPIMRR
jgi:2-methylcitrate dehydratase PrpD